MKIRLFSILLVAVLAVSVMTGCQAARTVQSAGRAAEHGVESAVDTVKQAIDPTGTPAASNHAKPKLTAEDAQKIALKHAGFTSDQVTALRTEYEIERGAGHYDVEFRHGHWEYDYEIHADTGEILSYSKDD